MGALYYGEYANRVRRRPKGARRWESRPAKRRSPTSAQLTAKVYPRPRHSHAIV